ncbi:MATE family efflux transporter [Mesorhizobium sp. M1A.F.Ca.IN.020.03.2.1]|uniref:MATE family efflux transporter n=1 Tax=unclassified Mesorhizobium TaxID=325217 RepID=UPI000FCB860B|nr:MULTISPECIES: MATE family efflux transporter [unclassified Mesorhizobium]RUV07597.1 MATE family efflux transporter [Mesorhizobium sp. M1A.F.Ca.IN.020.03.2.1]RUV24330.1 MATE family efflux transporter [Mesorhizobium sp. M1A.F.Ca.IN.022.04.1.1]RWB32858.1 MAG: MATE family efflux transporter [Mesorhizobium sp.]RWD11106.1 MAG: MATE family efflux transporter [Mesorhizobium sp.]RWE67112.1 MAG: MATE family efflux transporter [Mesorhizobium sp.]
MEQKAPIRGSRPFRVTNRQVLAIAIPMTLAYLTTPLLGLVDTAVVGRFGDAALVGGVASGAVLFDIVFATFSFLRSGTTALVAQAFGRNDALEERAVFWRAFVIAAISGMALVLFSPLIAAVGEWFMNAGQPVTAAMDLYIRIRLIAASAALINYTVLGYFLGRGNSALGLLLQLLLNGTNVALSIFLGLCLGWGVAGVAWGTVFSQAIAMIAGMIILLGRFRAMPKMSRQHMFNMMAIWRILQLSGNIITPSCMVAGVYMLFTRQGAQLGTLTLAANAVLMHIFLVSGYLLDGFGGAAEQLAGRAVGACYQPAFSRAVRLTAGWGFALAGLASLVIFAFGEQLIGAITKAADVRAEAALYLPWAAFAAPCGVLAVQMTGIFVGATWWLDVRNMILISFAAFIAALFAFGQMFGNHGLWAAFYSFQLVRGIGLLLVLRRRAYTAFAQ